MDFSIKLLDIMTISSTHSDFCASLSSCNPEQWDHFRNRFSSTAADLVKPLDQLTVDYSEGRRVEQRWQDTALKVCRIVLMIIIFPWGLYVGLRYLLQRLIMAIIFPLQSCLIKCFRLYSTEPLNQARQQLQTLLNRTEINNPYLVRQIVLEKNGARYRALLVATAQSLATRRWVLQAPANLASIEQCAGWFGVRYTQYLNASLLIVQGPGAAGNDGEVPSTDLGEPYELALSCLEKDFDAQDIILCGHSLGTAAVGQAIKKHTFDTTKRKYRVVRQLGFDTTANVAYQWFGGDKCCCLYIYLGRIAAALVRWTGCMLDNVEASRILQDKQIPEVIIRAGEDVVIPEEASLTCGLSKLGITQHKKFIYLPDEEHNTLRFFVATVEGLLSLRN